MINVKRSIFCKFAGCGLQLYYQRAPLQVLQKSKCYTLHSFLRICRATILFGTISHGCFSMYLTYLHKRKIAVQQTISCSRSMIQKLELMSFGCLYR